jgi:hypothetical protein
MSIMLTGLSELARTVPTNAIDSGTTQVVRAMARGDPPAVWT